VYRASGDLDRAYELTRRAVDVWKASDVGGAAGGLHHLAVDEWLRGNHDRAIEHAMRARDHYAGLSPPDLVWIVALVRGSMGIPIDRKQVLSEYEALFQLPPKEAALRLISTRLERLLSVVEKLPNERWTSRVRKATETARAALRELEEESAGQAQRS
jgi:hypothetical protein